MVTKAFKKAEDAGPVDVSELEKIAVDCIPSFLNLGASKFPSLCGSYYFAFVRFDAGSQLLSQHAWVHDAT